MKKIIALSLIASALFISSNSYCMFKHCLRTQKYRRTCHTKPSSFKLPRTNIFNAPHIYHHGLLEDLYDRNNNTINDLERCIYKLQQQNDIAVGHVYHEEPLDRKKLELLEQELQKILNTK